MSNLELWMYEDTQNFIEKIYDTINIVYFQELKKISLPSLFSYPPPIEDEEYVDIKISKNLHIKMTTLK